MSTVTTREKKKSYFREVQNELKKVTWTSKPELFLCTKVVIFSTIFFGLTVYVADLGIRGVLDLISSLLKLMIG